MNVEIRILDWIQTLRTPFLDTCMVFITRLGNGGRIWIVLTILLILIPKTRKSGFIMLVSLIISFLLCNVLIKNLVCRIRPYDVNTSIHLLVGKLHDYSFPSGHTASSFASVTALYLAKEKKLCKLTLGIAIWMSISRLYLYVHYPTDILGGILVGVASAYLGNRFIKKINK